MPVKSTAHRPHHVAHKKEKRTKHFLKVYAPYIPLILIIGCGLFLSGQTEIHSLKGDVKSYATNTTDDGLLESTNQMRAEAGLQPLRYNKSLDEAAHNKGTDMSLRDYWSHTTPDGLEPWVFIEQRDYKFQKAAENLAFGFSTSKSTVAGWMNSPGHRANILDPDLQEVGFGIINAPNYQGKGPETIVVAMYGQPLIANASSSVPLPVKPTSTPAPTPPEPQKISYLQTATAGKAPWSTFAAGIIIGSIIMYFVFSHARSLRRSLRSSERFVVKHPLFDITLVALLTLIVIASQTIGMIY